MPIATHLIAGEAELSRCCTHRVGCHRTLDTRAPLSDERPSIMARWLTLYNSVRYTAQPSSVRYV
jgi:hypothetical protein